MCHVYLNQTLTNYPEVAISTSGYNETSSEFSVGLSDLF